MSVELYEYYCRWRNILTEYVSVPKSSRLQVFRKKVFLKISQIYPATLLKKTEA